MPPKRKSPSGGKGLRSQLRVGDTDSNASSVKMLTRGRKQNGGKKLIRSNKSRESVSVNNPRKKKKTEMKRYDNSQDLPHAQIIETPQILLNTINPTLKKRNNMKYHTDEEEGDEFEQNDNVMNEDNVSVDNNLIDENEDEDELLEDEDEHEDEEDDEQEDEEDDESCDDNGVLQTPQEQVSLTKQYGSPRNKRLDIPLKLFQSSESGVEQVSLESDLTDSLQKDRKYLTSDNDLRRIIENQRKEIEKLNSRLLGRKKLEINPIQEGHVRKLVKIELWKRIQFIRHMHVLDGYESDGTIGKFVMDRLSIGENCREGFWECYKHVVRKTLKQHRNVVHSSLRKKFIAIVKAKILQCEFDPKDPCTYGVPSIEDFIKMRGSYIQDKDIRTPENKTCFLFYSYFLPSVGSVRIYANNMHKHKISKIFSPSLEGYVLIEIKNNYDKWTKQANDEIKNGDSRQYSSRSKKDNDQGDQGDQGSCKLTLYTETKYHKSIDGWSPEGMTEYNRLCHLAANDRETDIGKLFEENFIDMVKKERGLVSDQMYDMEQQLTMPYNDLLNSSVNDC